MSHFPLVKSMGDRAILIEFEPEINEDTLKKVLAVQKLLQENYLNKKLR